MTYLSLPSLFVCLFCLILALSVLPIIPEQTSTLLLECVASVSVRIRIKERGTRAEFRWWGLERVRFLHGENEEGGGGVAPSEN